MQHEMKTTQEQDADQMASGTANSTTNNSLQIQNVLSCPRQLPITGTDYLNDLHIVAGDHKLRVICHEITRISRLCCVIFAIPSMVLYPMVALLIQSVDTTAVVDLNMKLTSIKNMMV